MTTGKNTTQNPAPVPVSEKRARQLSNAMIVVRILDEQYFDRATQYINANEMEKFIKLCVEEAKIPQDLAERMWGYATVKPTHPKYQW